MILQVVKEIFFHLPVQVHTVFTADPVLVSRVYEIVNLHAFFDEFFH